MHAQFRKEPIALYSLPRLAVSSHLRAAHSRKPMHKLHTHRLLKRKSPIRKSHSATLEVKQTVYTYISQRLLRSRDSAGAPFGLYVYSAREESTRARGYIPRATSLRNRISSRRAGGNRGLFFSRAFPRFYLVTGFIYLPRLRGRAGSRFILPRIYVRFSESARVCVCKSSHTVSRFFHLGEFSRSLIFFFVGQVVNCSGNCGGDGVSVM